MAAISIYFLETATSKYLHHVQNVLHKTSLHKLLFALYARKERCIDIFYAKYSLNIFPNYIEQITYMYTCCIFFFLRNEKFYKKY